MAYILSQPRLIKKEHNRYLYLLLHPCPLGTMGDPASSHIPHGGGLDWDMTACLCTWLLEVPGQPRVLPGWGQGFVLSRPYVYSAWWVSPFPISSKMCKQGEIPGNSAGSPELWSRAAGTQWKASISSRFKNRLGVWVACKRLNLSFCTWRALRNRIRGSVEEIFKNKSWHVNRTGVSVLELTLAHFLEIYFAVEGTWGWGYKQSLLKPGGSHGKIRADRHPIDVCGQEEGFNSLQGIALLRAVWWIVT